MFANSEMLNETDRLRKFACRLTHNENDAEDLLHSTIVRALEKKHLYKDNTNLFGWMSKIMFNMFVSQYRRKVKFETQYDPENYLDKESVEPSQNIKMQLQEVDHAMDEMSEDHRKILTMVCVRGMRYAEVSEALQIPVGTVRSRLSRARESLQIMLDSGAALYGSNPISSGDGLHQKAA